MKRNFIEHFDLKANGSNLMNMNFGTWVLETLFFFLKFCSRKSRGMMHERNCFFFFSVWF